MNIKFLKILLFERLLSQLFREKVIKKNKIKKKAILKLGIK